MARKPNYNFERKERDRAKAEKLAAKAKAKLDEKVLADCDGDNSAISEDKAAPSETNPVV